MAVQTLNLPRATMLLDVAASAVGGHLGQEVISSVGGGTSFGAGNVRDVGQQQVETLKIEGIGVEGREVEFSNRWMKEDGLEVMM